MSQTRRLAAILAADVETTRDPHIAFDGERIFTSDGSDDGQGPPQLIGKRHRLLPRVRQRGRSAGGEFF
jgi:hypothetical protein